MARINVERFPISPAEHRLQTGSPGTRLAVFLDGVHIDLLEFSEAVESIIAAAAPGFPGPLAVASANLDHLHHFGSAGRWAGCLPQSPPWSAPAGQMQWLNLLDGAPLVAQARRLTGRKWPRLAGSDLIGPLLERCGQENLRLGFLGGSSEVQEQLRAGLAEDRPGLQVAGWWSPDRAALSNRTANLALAAQIREAGVDVLVVGLGKPRQELWIAEYGALTGARVLLAFGAVVDFLAGRVQRAPRWISARGLEWAWRLGLEPRRLARRYLMDGPPSYLRLRRRSNQGAPALLEGLPPLQPVPPAAAGRFLLQHEPADVCVLVVTYNNQDDVDPLLASLRAETADLRIRVVAADNASVDQTRARLGQHPDVLVVPTGGNLGYAGGINAAASLAGPTSSILVLNPDLRVERGALLAMVRRLSTPGTGIVVPLLHDPDGSVYRSLRREPAVLHSLGDALMGRRVSRRPAWASEIDYDDEAYAYPHPVDWATGAAVLVRANVAQRLGPWDERFFLYSEETEYFRRARDAGARVWFEPAARMIHRRGGSGAFPELTALMAVNRQRYVELHHGRGYALAFRGTVLLSELLRARDTGHRLAAATLLRRSRWARLPSATRPAPVGTACSPGAVIIPAHNEEAVIARTLTSLAGVLASGTVEVLVVCNGCTDSTASVAAGFAGVRVIETDRASKTAALNAGDAAARTWPRLYLDADIGVTEGTVDAVFRALNEGVPAVRPAVRYDTEGAGFLVRSYYRARRNVPAGRTSLWGAGAYGLSRTGHERLAGFPDIVADDLYVDRLFGADEKRILENAPVRVLTPRSVPGLMAVLRRTYRGNRELQTGSAAAAGNLLGVLAAVRSPLGVFDAAVYAGFAVAGRFPPPARRHRQRWERDNSSRAVPGEEIWQQAS